MAEKNIENIGELNSDHQDIPVEVVKMIPPPRRCGGRSAVTDLKLVEEKLNDSLTKLAAGGDGPNYKLGKVYSATRQIVSGSKYKIIADLVDENGETKQFNISIWSQPWLPDGIQVTFECEGEPTVVRKHSA